MLVHEWIAVNFLYSWWKSTVIILFLPIFYTIVCGNKTFEKGTSFSLSDAQSLNDWDDIDVGAVMSVLNKHFKTTSFYFTWRRVP